MWLQLAGLVAFNGFYWRGVGKYLCVPVLNCYACPVGAVACPIGSLTAFAQWRLIPYYIIGTIGIVGVSVGRAFCGWACPFGLLQDALYRIRSPKWRLPRAADGVKYAMLAVLVIGLPWMLGGSGASGAERILEQDTGSLDYCALFCPVGTLEAGIPGLMVNPDIRARASWRTWSKLGILVMVLGLVVVSRRSFCRGLCPLGALIAASDRSGEVHAMHAMRTGVPDGLPEGARGAGWQGDDGGVRAVSGVREELSGDGGAVGAAGGTGDCDESGEERREGREGWVDGSS